jgi:formate dehydrogenase accessory protein FdhD
MFKMIENVPAVHVNEKNSQVEEKIVCDEEIEIIINETVSRSFSISPCSLKEFAIGYMLGEGLAVSIDNITELNIEDRIIHVGIDLADFDIRKELLVGSDCFGGWRRKIELVEEVKSDFHITKEDLFNSFNKLREESKVWGETGGTHIAGLVNKDKFLAIEDVSRHVAVDKVIGAGALNKCDFSNSFIVYS